MSQYHNTIPLFTELSEQDQLLLNDVCETIIIAKDDIIIQEGQKLDRLYIIKSGQAGVFKHDSKPNHAIEILDKNDVIGEISFLSSNLTTASVQALNAMELVMINGKKLKESKYINIRHILEKHLHNSVTSKLTKTTDLASQFKKNYFIEKQNYSDIMLVAIVLFYMLSIYTLSLPGLHQISGYAHIYDKYVSSFLLFIYLSFTALCLFKLQYPIANLGLNLNNYKVTIKESLKISLVIMILFTVIKIYITLTYTVNTPVFNFIDSAIYLHEIAIYILLCPIQEFIIRGVVQNLFSRFMNWHSTKEIIWSPIILSNLMFSAFHGHLASLFVTMATFFLGILWGWMFYRQKTLLGVSLSHILIGTWLLFFLGINIEYY